MTGVASPVALACAAVWSAVFFAINLVDRRLLAFGDVRLALVIGLGLGWLGVRDVLLGYLAANLIGMVIGLSLLAAEADQAERSPSLRRVPHPRRLCGDLRRPLDSPTSPRRLMTQRPATTAPWWLFCLAVVTAWLLGAELAVFTAVGRSLPTRLPGLAVWTLVALSIAFLAVTGRREIVGGRQTVRLIEQLKEALGSIGMLTETSLAALPLDELLAQLLARLGEALETDVGRHSPF